MNIFKESKELPVKRNRCQKIAHTMVHKCTGNSADLCFYWEADRADFASCNCDWYVKGYCNSAIAQTALRSTTSRQLKKII